MFHRRLLGSRLHRQCPSSKVSTGIVTTCSLSFSTAVHAPTTRDTNVFSQRHLFHEQRRLQHTAPSLPQDCPTGSSSAMLDPEQLDFVESPATVVLPDVSLPGRAARDRTFNGTELVSSSHAAVTTAIVAPYVVTALSVADKKNIPAPRGVADHWRPLPTHHPVFGMQQSVVPPRRRKGRPLLSTVHPAFGDPPPITDRQVDFEGPVTVGGFFLAIDPHLNLLQKNDCMNPSAHLTIRDDHHHFSRVRYRCLIESTSGFKLEVIVRFQVGWISPACRFAEMPPIIHLGSGFDISIPFVMHFTMVDILDEQGNRTGSSLYFSGTPFLGVSLGFVRIKKGKLVLNMEKGRHVDVERDSKEFVGSQGHKVHLRQLGFVAFKCFSYFACALFCVPYFDLWTKLKFLIVRWAPEPILPLLFWFLPVLRECEVCSGDDSTEQLWPEAEVNDGTNTPPTEVEETA